MSIQVLPTAPSPTVTHFMNFEAIESQHSYKSKQEEQTNKKKKKKKDREI